MADTTQSVYIMTALMNCTTYVPVTSLGASCWRIVVRLRLWIALHQKAPKVESPLYHRVVMAARPCHRRCRTPYMQFKSQSARFFRNPQALVWSYCTCSTYHRTETNRDGMIMLHDANQILTHGLAWRLLYDAVCALCFVVQVTGGSTSQSASLGRRSLTNNSITVEKARLHNLAYNQALVRVNDVDMYVCTTMYVQLQLCTFIYIRT